MTLALAPTTRAVLSLTLASLTLMVLRPRTVVAQDTSSRQEACPQNPDLKATRMVPAIYPDEATKKKLEGTVEMCVTVDGNGKVTSVKVLDGPPEFFQSSIDAAKQWEFEPPSKAPITAKMQQTYSLTGPCPEGEGSDAGVITIGIGSNLDDDSSGAMKILDNVSEPSPPYPEVVRTQRVQGQLHLDMVVNPDGKVSDVRIIRPLDEGLDKLAVVTVRTWVFKVSSAGKSAIFPVTLTYRIPCLNHQ